MSSSSYLQQKDQSKTLEGECLYSRSGHAPLQKQPRMTDYIFHVIPNEGLMEGERGISEVISDLNVLQWWKKYSEPMLSFRLAYIFLYNLFQFCGHTWVLANTIARFLTFGRDALADTFYSVGFVMSLCQLLSILELFHIADGIEKARLLPRFIHVTEKNLLLIMVIMLEEIQSKPVVCVQFVLWNILDLLRYPHEMLCALEKPSIAMLWTRYTLWIPLYILSVATEVITIYQALPYIELSASNSSQLNSTASTHVQHPFLLMTCLPVLAFGASVTVWQLLKERQIQLDRWKKQKKKKKKK